MTTVTPRRRCRERDPIFEVVSLQGFLQKSASKAERFLEETCFRVLSFKRTIERDSCKSLSNLKISPLAKLLAIIRHSGR